MTRTLLRAISALLLVAVTGCERSEAEPATAVAQVAFKGTKGVNLHNWFTYTPQVSPGAYRLPVFQKMPGELTPAEARALRATGFDFIRLTVDPGVFILLSGPDLTQATDALAAGIDRLRAAGLSVVVDMHPVRRVQPDPASGLGGVQALERGPADPMARRFQLGAATLAGALDRRFGGTGQVAFELLNEPDLPCGAASWRAQQAGLHRAVRAAAPRLTLVLTGTCWDGIDGLMALRASDYADPNTLFSIHFYDDHRFTHQGTNGAPVDQATGGLPYPWNARDRASVDADSASRLAMLPSADSAAVRQSVDRYMSQHWDRAKIEARLDKVVDWARANGVAPNRILMGEFGVNASRGTVMGARDADRLRWLTDVRRAAEARGFRWSYWLYRGMNKGGDDFDLVNDGATTLDPPTLVALGLVKR